MRVFIVGTDTDVGKTYYGQQLIGEGKKVIKPIETGRGSFEDLGKSDSYTYAKGQSLDLKSVNCYFFTEAVSPHFASELDGQPIDLEALKAFISKEESIYIELAGGLMVPIQGRYTQLDLIKETENAGVVLVVANKLGCINHALMTMKVLENEGLVLCEVVINNLGRALSPCMSNNIETIKGWLGKGTPLRII
jgi:dethiobiotin synthase